jgi:drug/metabolite transporter (DMT)-like permease
VNGRYAVLLLVLGATWGSSYLFIRIGVRDLSPAVLVEIRLICAVPPLLAFAASRYGWAALRRAWRQGLVLGAMNAAIPFTLIAWDEEYVDSGTAAVANASVPIFLALLAVFFVPTERSTGLRLVGVLLGLVGVAVLAGVHPPGGWRGAAGTGAIVVASVSYAAANLYAGRNMALVAYLLPAFALLYGAVFLHEPLTAQKLAGLALITGGVALGAGAVRLSRRTVPA